MKGPTIEEVRALQEETGEGMMACKKILEQKYAEEEKKELIKAVQEIKYMLNAPWETYNARDILVEIGDVLAKIVQRI